jgi:hypothetical protein
MLQAKIKVGEIKKKIEQNSLQYLSLVMRGFTWKLIVFLELRNIDLQKIYEKS